MKVICLVSKGGPNVAALTYEAPEDVAVGDSGTVPMYNRDMGQEVSYPAIVIGLESTYGGTVKPFVRRVRATTREDIIAALAMIGR